MRFLAAGRAFRGAGGHDRTQEVVIAGGVQTVGQIPITCCFTAGEPAGFKDPFSGGQAVVQLKGACLVAEKRGLTRKAMEMSRWKGTIAPCARDQRCGSIARSCRDRAAARRAPTLFSS
jgi:hypothetical protein